MSTNATIGIVNKDKSVSSIYLHNDGYISHAGLILFNYFNTWQKAKNLINLGDLSSIDKNIEPNKQYTHSFDSPQPDVCVFYHRDRDEDLSIAEDPDEKSFSHENRRNLVYLFKNDKWYINFDNKLQKLETVLANNDLLKNEPMKITAVGHWGPTLHIMVKYADQIFEVIYREIYGKHHFFYENGKKPKVEKFEEKLLVEIEKENKYGE